MKKEQKKKKHLLFRNTRNHFLLFCDKNSKITAAVAPQSSVLPPLFWSIGAARSIYSKTYFDAGVESGFQKSWCNSDSDAGKNH